MEYQHTPGPWAVNTAGTGKNGVIVVDEIYVYAPGPNDDIAIAADIIDPATGDPSMANARLVAASPSMFNALEIIAAGNTDPDRMIEIARAVVAKAKGARA